MGDTNISEAVPDLFMVVGLTGVGKSTVLSEVMRAQLSWRLLPNRRELTDRIIFPAVQRRLGVPVTPSADRLERFRLTAAYRDMHPGGMAHALGVYLRNERTDPADRSKTFVFDNLRGLAEVAAAGEAFPRARFVLLDATPATRLARLVERRDPFDRVTVAGQDETAETAPNDPSRATTERHADRLRAIPGADSVFDVGIVAAWAAREGIDAAELEPAAQIIVEEQCNYDSTAARRHLAGRLPPHRFLAIDTDALSPAEVVRRVLAWLEKKP